MNKISDIYIKKINDVLDESKEGFFTDAKKECIGYAIVYALAWIAEELQEMNADVQHVVSGRWVKTVGENGVTSACRCSECGFEDNRYSLFNFCPNCGAPMVGGNF